MGRIFDVVQKYRVERTQTDEPAGIHLLKKDLLEDPGVQAGDLPLVGLKGPPASNTGLTSREEPGRNDDRLSTERSMPALLAPDPPQREVEPVAPSEEPPLAVTHGQMAPAGSGAATSDARLAGPWAGADPAKV